MNISSPLVATRGFTLTELAMVLVIVALLIGTLVLPLSAQQEIRHRTEAERELVEIREALIGFSIINKRLPCPATATDPTDANYGKENRTAGACSAEGILPWRTLGLREVDPWGTARTATADSFNGYWRYRVDVNFAPVASTITLGTTAGSGLSIKNSAGTLLTDSTTSPPVAIIYSTGPDQTISGLNGDGALNEYQSSAPNGTFDDLLIWISQPLLISRMVAAGVTF